MARHARLKHRDGCYLDMESGLFLRRNQTEPEDGPHGKRVRELVATGVLEWSPKPPLDPPVDGGKQDSSGPASLPGDSGDPASLPGAEQDNPSREAIPEPESPRPPNTEQEGAASATAPPQTPLDPPVDGGKEDRSDQASLPGVSQDRESWVVDRAHELEGDHTVKELRALAEDLRVDIDSRARKSEIAHAVADAQWQERNLKE